MMNKPLVYILAGVAVVVAFSASPFSSAASATSAALAAPAVDDTRYAWVDNLTLRAAPDVKAEALARLSLGTSVQLLPTLPTDAPLVHREENVVGPKLDKEAKGKPLKIVGDWRRVRVGNTEGWMFDGYLSRYPYPRDGKNSDRVVMEFAAAKNLFGVNSERRWATADGVNAADFHAMPQRLRDETVPQNTADITWDVVGFSKGGEGELSIDAQEGGIGWVVALDNLPMTYGEALLWARRWGWLNNNIYGAAFKEGHAKLRLDNENSNSDLDYAIDCQTATCNIHYSMGSE